MRTIMKTVYVGQVNKETDKVYFAERVDKPESRGFDTNCYEFLHCCMLDKEDAKRVADKYNDDFESGKLILKKCKDCGIYFFISKEEATWFEDRDLQLPVRCPYCRKMKSKKRIEGDKK